MDRSGYFYKQVQLLLQVLPFISKHSCFALKGGTAINLFVRNLPRLSVDIDLVYLPVKERNEALSDIKETLREVSDDLLDNEGLTDDLRKALLIYIISHNRPISELLKPVFKDIDAVYKSEFADMTEIPVSLEELQFWPVFVLLFYNYESG